MKEILVADDDVEIVNSIKEMLAPYCSIDTATTGIEVLQTFEKRQFNGLIIDVDFGPGINGLEIASILRARNKDLRILVFSATDYSDAIRQQVVDIGAVFCEKPLRLNVIRKLMEI